MVKLTADTAVMNETDAQREMSSCYLVLTLRT